MPTNSFDVLVIGGGHAGAEAAWAAANLGCRVALVTMDPAKIGAMSCNPAIGGLAKGQIVREIDALGGLMGLATDATGIQFRMLNASKGPAVQGPRAQCDKYRYAQKVQELLATRPTLTILAGVAERLLVDPPHGIRGLVYRNSDGESQELQAAAVVLTTGTFMRGLMHTGPARTIGGRVGEGSAETISDSLRELGLDLGRLKTGTPPRLAAESIDVEGLPPQPGDEKPVPFSDMTDRAGFPAMPQVRCWLTQTDRAIHEMIRANRDRAPLFNGQIAPTNVGPRYCPSIEDKVFRFADKDSHHVFLEPESLSTNEIYCNGISTSLPADVQELIVHHLPGCEKAVILRYGYAVEYDMVWPHQIDSTTMAKKVPGLFLAGQINGTSGYEEAAGQGLLAGLNAARLVQNRPLVRLSRQQSYIGVMMDDLVTKTPREPYRMFTSRAEWRLLLRADNAADRLTPLGREWGLVDDARWAWHQQRQADESQIRQALSNIKTSAGDRLLDQLRRPEVEISSLIPALKQADLPVSAIDDRLLAKISADVKYAGYIQRQEKDVQKLAALDQVAIPSAFDFDRVDGLRNEARMTLKRFAPTTLGQAGRLAGITPSDVMLLSVALRR